MNLNEELAWEDVISADILLDEGLIDYDEYLNEIKEIDEEYGTNFYPL